MSIKLQQLLSDFHVDCYNSGSEISNGWIGIQCPYCGDDKHHLGYNEKRNLLTCWKCGPKKMFPTLKLLLGKSGKELSEIIKNYGSLTEYESEEDKQVFKKNLVLPSTFRQIDFNHKRYLKSRGFDWKEICSRWNIYGTGRDGGNYRDRIIIPIYYQNKLVSFHSRDITGEARTPKKACSMEEEVIHFKNTLYGYDAVPGNTVIVTEGPFDVWRFGYGAVCTWGIKYSPRQIDLLSTFKNIFIVYDSPDAEEGNNEENAAKQAERLANTLAIFQNVWIVDDLGSDPGKMKQRKADKIKQKMFELTKEKANV